MRWAFKLAYLGTHFHGSQRQPEVRTVEGEVLQVLQGQGFIASPRGSRFQVASRTDRGVSALGNVFALDCDADPRAVASVFSTSLEGVWCYAYARVSGDFNPRFAEERWYRYWFPGRLDTEKVRATARLFEGRHGFGSLAPPGEGGNCHVSHVEVHDNPEGLYLDVRADRFLQYVIRRMAGCLEMVSEGVLSQKQVAEALEGDPIRGRLAPPENLWLMDVRYAFPFQPFASQSLLEDVSKALHSRRVETRLLQALTRRMEGR